MKLKYYLRGMGIGIIVTTIILAISFSRREVEISDEQVMVRAAALGMMMPEEQTPEETEKAEATELPTAEESGTDAAKEPIAENDTYRLVIQQGDVCRVVCEKLEENGVIDDAEALRTYLFELGYANSISTGEYDVPYGLTMEQVAEIIVAGPLE